MELADESRHTLNIRDETGDMFNIEPVQVKSTDSLIHCAALISLNFYNHFNYIILHVG